MALISPAMNFGDWSFEKTRPVSKSSDDFSDDTRIRVQPDPADRLPAEQDALQDRYLSSEEDLSPVDSDFDDTISLGEEEPEILEASVVKPVAVGRAQLATMVSFQTARPMMVQIPKKQPASRPVRSTSLKRAVGSVERVPIIKAPTPPTRKHQLSSVRNASSVESSPEMPPTPEVPARSAQRPLVRPTRSPTAPAFLERDPCPGEAEQQPPTPPPSKAFSKMRGLGRSFSISKKVVEPLRKASASESSPRRSSASRTQSSLNLEDIPASAPRPQMVARGASERAPIFELPPVPLDNQDYGAPRARRQLRRRRSTLSLVVT